MLLTQSELKGLLDSVATVWAEGVPQYNEIDSKYGDGDHGVTIGKISKLISRSTEAWQDEPIRAFLIQLSNDIMGIGGGSAGPLYGLIFDGFASAIPMDVTSIDADYFRQMIIGAKDSLESITKATIGDKTMMDALLPAVAAVVAGDGDIPQLAQEAAAAAVAGADATKEMVSKFGRARSYGDRTIGTPDAGALSTAALFEGMAKYLTTLD
jgi:dihydroxyacetone kinase-like protein